MTDKEQKKLVDDKSVINSEVSAEMKKAYLDYAMSVIVSRAIPSIEDGLKPVQRRKLFIKKILRMVSSQIHRPKNRLASLEMLLVNSTPTATFLFTML